MVIDKIKEGYLRYYSYFIGARLKIFKSIIRLWHREVMDGPDLYLYSDDARSTSDFISLQRTKKWLNRAWKYHLEVPPYDDEGDFWFSRPGELVAPDEPRKLLTNKGIRFILNQYREEKSARRDTLIKWATLVFSAIAALGVLFKMK